MFTLYAGRNLINRSLHRKVKDISDHLKSISLGVQGNSSFTSSTAQHHEGERVESSDQSNPQHRDENPQLFNPPPEYRFIYPEFLPISDPALRHPVREKLERLDMLRRRTALDIPEFYVGSVLAVTVADPFAPGKKNRFVGICIIRENEGMRANFTLRNAVDGQGVEITYDLYNPTIHLMEVLRLERRLDDHLLYLRDAPLEHSTFPFDMEPELLPQGAPIPVNTKKISLNPRPWCMRWEIKNLKGVNNIDENTSWRRKERAAKSVKPWEKWDLMKEYRELIPAEDQSVIYSDVQQHMTASQQRIHRTKRRSEFVRPKKTT